MYRLIATSIGITLISLLAVGCGSSGDNTTTAQITKTQFIEQVRDVCAKTKSEMKTRAAAWEGAHKGKELGWDAALKKVLGPSLKQQAAALEDLTPPKELEEEVTRMITNLSEGAANFVNDGEKADAAGFKHFQNEAETLGAKACNI